MDYNLSIFLTAIPGQGNVQSHSSTNAFKSTSLLELWHGMFLVKYLL